MAVAAEPQDDGAGTSSTPAAAPPTGGRSFDRGVPREDLRVTWSAIDALTSLKHRSSNPPSAALIRRKIDALSLPATETLGVLVDLFFAIAEKKCRLSPRQVDGLTWAVKCFPENTATEVADVHARREVVSVTAVKAAWFEAGHILRLGIESLTAARVHGIPLVPIATDRHTKAVAVLEEGKPGCEKAALEMLGNGDAVVLKGRSFVSSKGLLTGTALCVAVMERLDNICCGRCRRVVDVGKISICSRCGDQLVCKACSVGGKSCAWHESECKRVRGGVRAMAQSLIPSLRQSARHVAVVQLDRTGLMVPMSISSIGSPLTPSSLWESISRCSKIVTPTDAVVYWRLLVAFLADPDGDEQVISIGHGDDRYYVRPAEHAVEVDKQPAGPARRAPTHLSEKRRLRKGLKLAERKAMDDARDVAEASAMAEANAVLLCDRRHGQMQQARCLRVFWSSGKARRRLRWSRVYVPDEMHSEPPRGGHASPTKPNLRPTWPNEYGLMWVYLRPGWLRLYYSSGALAHGFGITRSCVARSAVARQSSFSAQFEPGYS